MKDCIIINYTDLNGLELSVHVRISKFTSLQDEDYARIKFSMSHPDCVINSIW